MYLFIQSLHHERDVTQGQFFMWNKTSKSPISYKEFWVKQSKSGNQNENKSHEN